MKFFTKFDSLAYRKRFLINNLMVDKPFVTDAMVDPYDAAIAQIIINRGTQLNFDVISEGVETIPKFEFLRENGCNVIQGYHFSL